MKKLFFSLMLMGAMISCAPKNEAPKADAPDATTDSVQVSTSELMGEWSVVTIAGTEVKMTSEPLPVIQFQDSLVSGNAGCNTFNGGYELSAEALTFGDFAVTKMMCPDMQVEDAFLQAIHQVASFKIADNKLSLLNAEGQEVIGCEKKVAE